MKTMATCALMALAVMTLSGTAQAGDASAERRAEMGQACAAQGGRFERLWVYSEQGGQWGELLSCTTDAGFISCQGELCRSARWVAGETEPAAFLQALNLLTGE